MPAPDLLSIVITTYNRSDALVAVLAGLAVQDDRSFEVIVADDGSTQAHQNSACAASAALHLDVIHVWHPDVGFTASRVRNLGVSAASGNYIILLDGDCVPEVDFVRRHRMLMQPGHFVNGSRVLLSEQLTSLVLTGEIRVFERHSGFWIAQRMSGNANKLGPRWRLPDFGARTESGFRWKGIRSCNMGVWRTDYERINGFDESFIGWGHEDADFVLRLHSAGVKRKNGFFATEVYHLWHREASRITESRNAATVRARIQSGQVLSTIGYRESKAAKDVVTNRWG